MRKVLLSVFVMLCSVQMFATNILVECISGAQQTHDIAKIGKLIFVDNEIQLLDKLGNILATETLGNVRQITFVESSINTDLDSVQPGEIVLYPNPTHDIIYISGIESTDLRVYDLQGRMLIVEHGHQVTVSSLPLGTYLLQIGTQVVRFIKQ
jgi:hypothetical protein